MLCISHFRVMDYNNQDFNLKNCCNYITKLELARDFNTNSKKKMACCGAGRTPNDGSVIDVVNSKSSLHTSAKVTTRKLVLIGDSGTTLVAQHSTDIHANIFESLQGLEKLHYFIDTSMTTFLMIVRAQSVLHIFLKNLNLDQVLLILPFGILLVRNVTKV
jgi:hypothetical protein